MKKTLLSIVILIVIFIVACQQPVKEQVMEKTPATTATGEAAVDAVGNDLTNVNSVEKDLGTDELSDLDAGLTDVQNI